jgi:anti-sigma-K factor RskA
MNHEEWLAQAEIYALGALDGGELMAFEVHLAAGCPACEQHMRTTREALALLPRSLMPVAPPSHVRERLLQQLATESARPQPVTPLPRRRWWMLGVSALAAACLLVALSYHLYQTRRELQQVHDMMSVLRGELQQRETTLRTGQQEVQRLQGLAASLQSALTERDMALQAERRELQRATEKVATLQAELARREETLEAERREFHRIERVVAILQRELDERDETLRLLSTPQVRLVRLAGLAASPGASGQLLWNPATRTGILLTSGLPQVPHDRVYELWAIAGNEPMPAGLFEVDAAGHAFLRLPSLPRTKRFDKFAVTLEPAAGVPKPTGPMHLLGSL